MKLLRCPTKTGKTQKANTISILKAVLRDALFSTMSRFWFSGTYSVLFTNSLENVFRNGDFF
jgi:hypothetical protein